MSEKTQSTFATLYAIDCNSHTEKKNGLTYLSWAWAWAETKKQFPGANYKVVKYDGKPYLFDTDLGYLVETEVTIGGETISMQLPVMDGNNKAQKATQYSYKAKEYVNAKWTGKYLDREVEPATMFDINTAIMRCLTKNLAMFGLGLYIYAGEDLPESATSTPVSAPPQLVKKQPVTPEKWAQIYKAISEADTSEKKQKYFSGACSTYELTKEQFDTLDSLV
jgi:hypothetical protein